MRGMARRFVQPLWEAIQRARQLSPDELPGHLEREQDRPPVGLDRQSARRDPERFLRPRKARRQPDGHHERSARLVRAKMQNEPASETNLLMTGWRKEFVLPILLDVLEGKRSVAASRTCKRNRRLCWNKPKIHVPFAMLFGKVKPRDEVLRVPGIKRAQGLGVLHPWASWEMEAEKCQSWKRIICASVTAGS